MRSEDPFPETVSAILERQGVSRRELQRRCQRHGWIRDQSVVARVLRGEGAISPEGMEAVAKALGIPPETFAEYRMWQERRKYDPDEVGFRGALQNLDAKEQALDEDGE